MKFLFVKNGLWRSDCGRYIVKRIADGNLMKFIAKRKGGTVIESRPFLFEAYAVCARDAESRAAA